MPCYFCECEPSDSLHIEEMECTDGKYRDICDNCREEHQCAGCGEIIVEDGKNIDGAELLLCTDNEYHPICKKCEEEKKCDKCPLIILDSDECYDGLCMGCHRKATGNL